MFQIRIVIKNIEIFDNIIENNNFKIKSKLGKEIQETKILWNYCINNPINHRFIFNIIPRKYNNLHFVLTNHSLTNHNQYVAYGKLKLSGIENILNGININNSTFYYFWDNPIRFNEIKHLDNYKNQKKIIPGLIIEDCILDLIDNKNSNNKIGNIYLEIYGIKEEFINVYPSGIGENEPNQYPLLKNNLNTYPKLIKKNIEKNKIKILTENINYEYNDKYYYFCSALNLIINNSMENLPLTVGIFGSEGTGKSLIIKKIKNILQNNNLESTSDKNFIILDFNPWDITGSDNIWAGFIDEIYKTIESEFGPFTIRTKRLEKKICPERADKIFLIVKIIFIILLIIIFFYIYSLLNQYLKILYWIISSVFGLDFIRNVYKSINCLFGSVGDDIVQKSKSKDFREGLGFMNLVKTDLIDIIIPFIVKRKKKMLVFIDNLDKCSVDKSVNGLELIKLLTSFQKSNFIIFITGNNQTLTNNIEIYYNKIWNNNIMKIDNPIDGNHFLNKIINLNIFIPETNLIKSINFIENHTNNMNNFENLNNSTTFYNIKNFVKFYDKYFYNKNKKYFENNEYNKLINKYHKYINGNKKLKNNTSNNTLSDKDSLNSNVDDEPFIDNFINSYEENPFLNNSMHSFELKEKKNEYILDSKINFINNFIKNNCKGDCEKNNKFTKDKIEENLNEILDYLKDIEFNIENLTLEILEERYYYLNNLTKLNNDDETQKKIDFIKEKFSKIFDCIFHNLDSNLFHEYDIIEKKTFINLSFYLGISSNIIKTKKIINVYNFSRYIIPDILYPSRSIIIQILFLSEFWNYKITWISLVLEKIHQKYYLENKSFIERIDNIPLLTFYENEVTEIINYQKDKHIKWEKYDYPTEDFVNINKKFNLTLLQFYKLSSYIYNIDNCLKSILNKYTDK